MRAIIPLLLCALLFLSCASREVRQKSFLATAYCPCGECNGYNTGSWYFLYLDRWNKSINYGPHEGQRYTGKTAGGYELVTPRPGFFSTYTITHPHRVLFPWKWDSRRGTIAADTQYYPLGTKMTVPGWGKGIVDDRGGAIKGPERLDLFLGSHRKADKWGRRKVLVEIETGD